MQFPHLEPSMGHNNLFKKETPSVLDWLLVIILASIAFVCFDQAYDMINTMKQSSDLIKCISEGRFFHFYEYVLQRETTAGKLTETGTLCAASYNIIIYIIFAIWTLPVYLLNAAVGIARYDYFLNLWGRILVIGLSIYCAHLITVFAAKFTNDSAKAKWMGYFFLSSPIFIYCVIIQNQYDIFPVLATLLALFFYFDKKYYRFSAVMSLAICCKIFPVLIFFPLLFLAEKRLTKLFQYIAIGISPYLITTLIFSIFDPGYLATQNLLKTTGYDFIGRIYAAQIQGGTSNISIFLVLMILICIIAYYIKPAPTTFPAVVFTLCTASYASFFIFVEWHPQWFVIILPFFTLMIFSMKNIRLGMLLETAVTASFLFASSLNFLTVYMMNNSILVSLTKYKYILADQPNPLYNFFAAHGYSIVPVISVFAGFLCALLLVAFLDLKSDRTGINYFDVKIKIERRLLYLRSLTILIYVLPPIVYYLSSPVR
jgi:hypothetical protein